MSPVKTIPEGYHTLTPYLIVKGAADAIEFYKRAFAAEEMFRMNAPDGRIGHAELKVGDSVFMLAEEVPEQGFRAPQSLNWNSVSFLLYVEDVDAAFARALGAGATLLRPVEDKYYGERMGSLADPFGHQWSLATHIEDVSPAELQRRAAEDYERTAKEKAAGGA